MTADPRHYSESVALRGGAQALVRAIRADDRERLQAAFRALEPESVYLRYFAYKHELSEADLDRLCAPDFRVRVVLVVTLAGTGADNGTNREAEIIVGCGGYVAHDTPEGARVAEVAFAVEEDVQGQGITSKLLAVLVDIARDAGIARFEAEVLARNTPMLQVFAHSGLPMTQERGEDGVVRLSLSLAPTPPPNPAAASR